MVYLVDIRELGLCEQGNPARAADLLVGEWFGVL